MEKTKQQGELPLEEITSTQFTLMLRDAMHGIQDNIQELENQYLGLIRMYSKYLTIKEDFHITYFYNPNTCEVEYKARLKEKIGYIR